MCPTNQPFCRHRSSGEQFDLGDIQLKVARTVGGFVRDSAGQPLAGVRVRSHAAKDIARAAAPHSEAMTDERGRFVLDRLHPFAAVAIVEKEGFRTTGFPLIAGQSGVKVTMFGTAETVPPEHLVRAQEFDGDARRSAAKKLLDHMLPRQRASGFFHDEAVNMLSRIDPDSALVEASESKSASVRVKALAKAGEIEDAMAEAETIEDAYRRAMARFSITDFIEGPEQTQDLLASALLDARSIRRPDRRTYIISDIAERFWQAGDAEQAEAILRDEMPQARTLATNDWPGYARGSFAQSLARFDPETALKIVSEADEDDQVRYLMNIAHRLAATDPDTAEEALKRIKNVRYVDAPQVRVAYRMAKADVERAIRLLDGIDDRNRPTERARGLAMIAMSIHEDHPERARDLLKQADAAIPKQHGGGGSRVDAITGASILILRFAEKIAPDQLNEYFWRAVANHPGPEGGAWSPDDAEEEDADRQSELAILLALYDPMPELPQQVMQPVFDYWENHSDATTQFTDRRASFTAMALTDPERAAEWSIRYYENLDKNRRRVIPQPWQIIGDTLTQDRDAIGKAIMRNVYHRWIIDEFDL